MNENLAKTSFWSTIWMFTDTIATKAIAFVIGIVLARLLSPSDFGIIGMMLVFTSLCDVIIESGTANALIRKTDRNKNDCSTAFFLNIGIATVAYILLFCFSHLIAEFYKEPIIAQLLKVAGLNVVLNALCIVPNALLIANFKTKKQAKVNFLANALSGISALALAYNGMGIWALVLQTVFANLIKVIGYWLSAKWHPNFIYSKQSLIYLWNYSSKSFLIGLLGTFFANIYNLLVGKIYSKVDLGYFARANQFAQLPSTIISSTFQKVSVATFTNLQDDILHLLVVYRKYIHVISFVSFSMFFYLSIISKPLIIILLTEKWIVCSPMLSLISIGCAFSPLGIINLCLLQAINRMDYSLKLEIRKKIVFVVILVCSIPFGVMSMICGSVIYNIVATGMNLSCSYRFIGYRYKDQLLDIGKYLLTAIVATLFSIVVYCFIDNVYLLFICITISFWGIYLGLVFMRKYPVIAYLYSLKRNI